MTSQLLLKGMLVGVLAGLLAFAFARVAGEPVVEQAIVHEAHAHEAHAHGTADEPELVSRQVQRNIGLLVGVCAYGVALGGVFALVFAFSIGRVGRMGPRQLALWIALLGFAVMVLIPSLKYPANPPGVGNPDTLRVRTALFFAMIALSLATLALAFDTWRRLSRTQPAGRAAAVAVCIYVGLIALVGAWLPSIDEAPQGFPTALLAQFQVASLAIQAVLWGSIGLGFGWAAQRQMRSSHTPRVPRKAPASH